jgi:hypothetical protein
MGRSRKEITQVYTAAARREALFNWEERRSIANAMVEIDASRWLGHASTPEAETRKLNGICK